MNFKIEKIISNKITGMEIVARTRAFILKYFLAFIILLKKKQS